MPLLPELGIMLSGGFPEPLIEKNVTDLETSDKTIKRWVKILDSLYYCYLIAPMAALKLKHLKRKSIVYHYQMY